MSISLRRDVVGLAFAAVLIAAVGLAAFALRPKTDWSRINAIPPENFAEFVKQHQLGLGHMERYAYGKAAAHFREARKLAPGLHAATINLAIANLNDTGVAAEKSKDSGGEVSEFKDKFEESISLLTKVIKEDPDNPHAHYCRGIILQYLGRIEEAHPDFVFVRDRDPSDGSAWYNVGVSLPDPENPGFQNPIKQAPELVEIFSESVKRNPYNAAALYALAMAYQRSGRPKDFRRVYFEEFIKLDPEKAGKNPGESGRTVYGEMGRYATVLDPLGGERAARVAARAPRFEVPEALKVRLPDGHRWVKESDFAGASAPLGQARARFGAAVAAFDADGDGLQDLYLAASVVDAKGAIRDALLLNKGDGSFEDASASFGLPADRASLTVAAGDFDADRAVDLFVAGIGERRLLRNVAGKKFEDQTALLKSSGPPAISPRAVWMDLDQDGDLDLYVVNYAVASDAAKAFGEKPPAGLRNEAFRNDGVPPKGTGPTDNWVPVAVSKEDSEVKAGLSLAFSEWTAPEALPLLGEVAPHTGVAVLDIDNDRDMDLVLSADGRPTSAVLNDRLGRFRAAPIDGLEGVDRPSGLLTIDVDRDGQADLVATSATGRAAAWRNASSRDAEGTRRLSFEPYPLDAERWRSASVADVDLDGSLDLLGLPAADALPAVVLARAEANRFATRALALGPDSPAPLQGLAYADVAGDALPDLVMVRDGVGPRVATNLGNGHRWIGLEIGGRWDVQPKHMRTNVQGLGVRVVVEGDGLMVPYDHTTPDTGPAQSVGPVIIGLGDRGKARLVRMRWPDGVLQCELDEDADRLMAPIENNRKEGSCPVLFTWDGERMVCLGDFLGGGGLGYLVAPGVYGQPDRDESVAISSDQLKVANGSYRMSITEPMSELAYLDKVTLEVVDRPPGVSAAPDERFAPGGNRPTGELFAWKTVIEPVHAKDTKGRDVTEDLRRVDRRFADDYGRSKGWIGYAEEHGIILDFGDRLAEIGPKDRVALMLTGVTEYPYSQTNYAAATAGVELRPPVLERLQPDGSWELIEADPGYPAGMERMTALELTGRLGGPSCVLRLRTNMDIAWDQAFAARLEDRPGLRVTTLPVHRAALSHRGYTREISPDGRLPLIYDYNYVDPAPLANLVGKLTRFGDVRPLLTGDDDQLCVIGPGDEVKVEFDAKPAPAAPDGWTRSFVLRTIGYCKDADPFTAGSDEVGPLPWRGMPAFPFGPEGCTMDAAYRKYLDEYQTRSVGR